MVENVDVYSIRAVSVVEIESGNWLFHAPNDGLLALQKLACSSAHKSIRVAIGECPYLFIWKSLCSEL